MVCALTRTIFTSAEKIISVTGWIVGFVLIVSDIKSSFVSFEVMTQENLTGTLCISWKTLMRVVGSSALFLKTPTKKEQEKKYGIPTSCNEFLEVDYENSLPRTPCFEFNARGQKRWSPILLFQQCLPI